MLVQNALMFGKVCSALDIRLLAFRLLRDLEKRLNELSPAGFSSIKFGGFTSSVCLKQPGALTRAFHTWYRMQKCVVHLGMTNVGREQTWCKSKLEFLKPHTTLVILS